MSTSSASSTPLEPEQPAPPPPAQDPQPEPDPIVITDQILSYVIDNVLGHGDDSPLVEALVHRDILDIPTLIGMSNDDIDNLTTVHPHDDPVLGAGLRTQMSSGLRGLLKAFKGYVRWLQQDGEPVDFLVLEKDAFDDFRVSPRWNPDATVQAPSPSPAPSRSLAEDFRRTVRRDKSHYKPFRLDKEYNNNKVCTMMM